MDSKLLKLIDSELSEALDAYQELLGKRDIAAQLLELAKLCSSSIRNGGIIFFAGNGGSFADAQHMAAEFSGKLSRPRKPLASIALGTNNSSISAIGNDFGFEEVFARELEAYSNPNSVVVAFSTSGTSENIVRLWQKSKELGLTFRAFTGLTHGKLDASVSISVPSSRTERIQEMHTTLGHLLCLLIEEELGIFESNF